jgi:hypothetical protein
MRENGEEENQQEHIDNLPVVPNKVTFDIIPGQEIQEMDHPEMPTAQQELLHWHHV